MGSWQEMPCWVPAALPHEGWGGAAAIFSIPNRNPALCLFESCICFRFVSMGVLALSASLSPPPTPVYVCVSVCLCLLSAHAVSEGGKRWHQISWTEIDRCLSSGCWEPLLGLCRSSQCSYPLRHCSGFMCLVLKEKSICHFTLYKWYSMCKRVMKTAEYFLQTILTIMWHC